MPIRSVQFLTQFIDLVMKLVDLAVELFQFLTGRRTLGMITVGALFQLPAGFVGFAFNCLGQVRQAGGVQVCRGDLQVVESLLNPADFHRRSWITWTAWRAIKPARLSLYFVDFALHSFRLLRVTVFA